MTDSKPIISYGQEQKRWQSKTDDELDPSFTRQEQTSYCVESALLNLTLIFPPNFNESDSIYRQSWSSSMFHVKHFFQVLGFQLFHVKQFLKHHGAGL